jgi:hypothetical protein
MDVERTQEQTGKFILGLWFCLLGLLNEIEKCLHPCLGGRGQEALHFVRGEMVIQELNDVHSEFPARDDSAAWKGFVDGTTVSEWNFTSELGAMNHLVVITFNHRLFFAHPETSPSRDCVKMTKIQITPNSHFQSVQDKEEADGWWRKPPICPLSTIVYIGLPFLIILGFGRPSMAFRDFLSSSSGSG